MATGNRLGGLVTALTGIFVRAGSQAMLLVVTLVAARFLAPTDFGIYAIASAAIALIRTLLHTGAYEYLLKAPPGHEAPVECLFINLGIAVLHNGLLLIAAPFAQSLVGAAAVGNLLLVMAPSNLISAVAAWEEPQVLRAGKLRGYYAVTAIAEMAAALAAVTLLFKHFGLMALVAQLYARNVILLGAYGLLQRPMWSWRFSVRQLMGILKWSSGRYASIFLSFVSVYGADFLLGAFLSPAASGFYRASSRIVSAVSDMSVQPMRIVAATLFSRCWARNEPPNELWPRVFAASAFVSWSALAGLAALAERIVPITLGDKWVGAGPIISLLCLARAFSTLDAVTGPLLVAFNYVRSLFLIQIITTLAGVVLLCAVARFGVKAAALSTVISSATGTLACAALSLRHFPARSSNLLRAMPVSVGPAFATFAFAAASERVTASADLSPLVGALTAVCAGLLGWALAGILLRRSALRAMDALNVSS